MRSIIIKGDDNRVQPMSVQDLSGKVKPKPKVPGEEDPCETRIEVLRVGGEIHGLEVHCSCGEVTVVELTYPKQ